MKVSTWSTLAVFSLVIDLPNCQAALRPAQHLRRTSQQTSVDNKLSEGLSFSIDSGTQQDRTLQEKCELNLNGNFGLIMGTPRLITFYYQTVLFPNTSTNEVENTILPKLERLMTAGILPYLFDCPDNTPLPNELIDGVSMSFDDQLVNCE